MIQVLLNAVYHAQERLFNHKKKTQSGNQTVSHSSLKHSSSEMKRVAVDPVYKQYVTKEF